MVLANSGRSLSVWETAKLAGGGEAAKPLYAAELKEGMMAAVYPGGCVGGGRPGGGGGGAAWLASLGVALCLVQEGRRCLRL